jgi:hypothetical protein
MKRFILFAGTMFLFFGLKSQTNDVWLLQCDSSNLDNCGYLDKDGNIKIPYGKYAMCYTDTFRNYAIILKLSNGFIGIDKQENKLFTVYPFDNGPDYISDGTFRIVENNRIGFADTSGRIIIKPIFYFSFEFIDGLAIVNIGGHQEKSGSDAACEHYIWVGGKWGVIDKTGKYVLDLKYNYNWNPDAKKNELCDGKNKFEIVKGKVIKTK